MESGSFFARQYLCMINETPGHVSAKKRVNQAKRRAFSVLVLFPKNQVIGEQTQR
jgi:hypothetical protein